MLFLRCFGAYAAKNAKNELGADAALAALLFDLTRTSLNRRDWLVAEICRRQGSARINRQYWQAQASLALGQKDDGLSNCRASPRFSGQRDDRTGRNVPRPDGAGEWQE